MFRSLIVIYGWGLLGEIASMLLKIAHVRRYPHPLSLRCTEMYVSFLGISCALHLDVFEQPEEQLLFSNLLGLARHGRVDLSQPFPGRLDQPQCITTWQTIAI